MPYVSPIFIIVMDPLLHYMEKAKLDGWGYFDDVANIAVKGRMIHVALSLFNAFGKASGLDLNPSKTTILTSKRPTWRDHKWRDDLRSLLRINSEDSLPLVDKVTYLGFLIGRNITTEDLFEQAVAKTIDRLDSYNRKR
jgi:hypothetical protein